MARKPYYRKACKAWYVLHNGKDVKLGKTEEEAMTNFALLMQGEVLSFAKVSEILSLFSAWVKANRDARTAEFYEFHLGRFNLKYGHLALADLKPFHVTAWISGMKGNTANAAVRAVCRVFNWAAKEGRIKANPLAGMERPAATAREVYVDEQQYARVFAKANSRQVEDVLVMLRETGCRPQELRSIRAEHLDRASKTITFAVKESKGKRTQRIIVLTDAALAVVSRLALRYASGPVFRTDAGRPWTKDSLKGVFRCLARRSKVRINPYALRHSWATDALMRDVPPMTVATLMGHTSINTIWKTYQKIQMRKAHMARAAEQAVRGAV